jgi:hypothetical protein
MLNGDEEIFRASPTDWERLTSDQYKCKREINNEMSGIWPPNFYKKVSASAQNDHL